MIHIIRKHQQPLMIMITILVILAFVWFYNGTRSMDRMGSDRFAKMYGSQYVSQSEAEAIMRKYQLANAMGMTDLVRSLYAVDQGKFAWQNMLVIQHEADLLQIHPTQDDIENAEKQMSIFQTNNQFDPDKLRAFAVNALPPNGFTTAQMEELIKTDLCLERIKDLLVSTAPVSPSEVQIEYDEMKRKMDISVIRLKLSDFIANIQVPDQDARARFDQLQQQKPLVSPEKRKVKFVFFGLTDAQKALKGKERTEILQNLANRAQDFTQAVLDKNTNFDAVAAKFQVPVQETGEFSQTEGDPNLGKNPAVAQAAFSLTQTDPNSDAKETEDGFYVLYLTKITPARPLTFDEAKAGIVEQIKTEVATANLSEKAVELRTKLLADIKAGKSFLAAAQAAGQKPETIPPFALSDKETDIPDIQAIIQKVVSMSDNQISEPVSTKDAVILIHLDKREPIDEAKFAMEKEDFATQLLDRQQEFVFQEWLRTRRQAANVQDASSG